MNSATIKEGINAELSALQMRRQCENCDEFYLDADAEQPGGYSCSDGKSRGFCCDDCHQEFDEKVRLARCEAKEQFDMYGTDLDSWYR